MIFFLFLPYFFKVAKNFPKQGKQSHYFPVPFYTIFKEHLIIDLLACLILLIKLLFISIFKEVLFNFPPIVSIEEFGRADALGVRGKKKGFLENLGGLDFGFGILRSLMPLNQSFDFPNFFFYLGMVNVIWLIPISK